MKEGIVAVPAKSCRTSTRKRRGPRWHAVLWFLTVPAGHGAPFQRFPPACRTLCTGSPGCSYAKQRRGSLGAPSTHHLRGLNFCKKVCTALGELGKRA